MMRSRPTHLLMSMISLAFPLDVAVAARPEFYYRCDIGPDETPPVIWSSDSRFALTLGLGNVCIADTQTRTVVRKTDMLVNMWVPASHRVLTLQNISSRKRRIEFAVMELPSGNIVGKRRLNPDKVSDQLADLKYASDGKAMVVITENGGLQLWNPDTLENATGADRSRRRLCCEKSSG